METSDVKLHEGRNRRLGYAQEFRQMVREHQGILKTALDLTQRAEAEYDPGTLQVGPYFVVRWKKEEDNWEVIKLNQGGKFVDVQMPINDVIPFSRGTYLKAGTPIIDPNTGLEVTILGKTNRTKNLFFTGEVLGKDRSAYFKVRLIDKAFFVKKSYATIDPGFDEFNNTTRVKEALSGIDNLRIVEAQLGYTDKHQSWFVSKWEDLESEGFFSLDALEIAVPDNYGKYPPDETYEKHGLPEALERTSDFVRQIKTRARNAGIDIHDIGVNLFYNPDRDEYFYLDVTTPSDRPLQPPIE